MTQGTGTTALSNKQRKLRARRIKAEQAAKPQAASVETTRAPKEVYFEPVAADGENIIHEAGQTGRPIAIRLDPLLKLHKAGRLTTEQKAAGELYLKIVQSYFLTKRGLERQDEEFTGSTRAADPIRLYTKGRRKYVPTQKPRVIGAGRVSSDGWSHERCGALDAMVRVRRALQKLDGPSLRTLYALVIHPNMPERRPTTIRAYTLQMFGYRNQKTEDQLVTLLTQALEGLRTEFGIVSLEKRAA